MVKLSKYWDTIWLILSDLHIPFHDKRLLNAIYDLCKDIQFTGIVFNGDLHDFFKISEHLKSADRADNLQLELDETRFVLKNFRNILPDAKFVHIEGNHERRLRKYLFKKAKELESLRCLNYSSLVGHDIFDIKYTDSFLINKNFLVTHGTSCGKYPARAELARYLISGTSGHSHKTDTAHMHGHKVDLVWHSAGHLSNRPRLSKACGKYDKALNWDMSFETVLANATDFEVDVVKCNSKGFYYKLNGKYYGKN